MPPTSSTKQPPFRFQGTDGIRREIRASTDKAFRGMTPQDVFLKRGYITEEFMELYAFAHVDSLMKDGTLEPGDPFVVGWDPRDTSGQFTSAVVRGVRKAGATVLQLGVVPTPLVPIYSLYKNAGGGFMITASHNPKDQNGIKTFLKYRGMKLLPDNDVALSKAIMKTIFASIKKKAQKGNLRDCRKDAIDLFLKFSLDPANAWTADIDFKDIVLVVDPANGSLSQIAAEAFQRAGFGKVVEVNGKTDGKVNEYSGVADLEGKKWITADQIIPGSGIFHKHKALIKLFSLGRKLKSHIQSGRKKVCGAVFDADGDRFYRVDYHPDKDALLVLSGDETAFLQARYLLETDSKTYQGTTYINTVESDLNAGLSAQASGFQLSLAPVGDKWILLQIVSLLLKSRMTQALKLANHKTEKEKVKRLRKQLQTMEREGTLDSIKFQQVERSLDRIAQNGKPGFPVKIPLAVGSEETGHNITLGHLNMGDTSYPVFFGNGLKSALNTFSATQYLLADKTPKTCWRLLEKPFQPGYKGTSYVYYVQKENFYRDSKVWKRVNQTIRKEAQALGYACKAKKFRADPDMLYQVLTAKDSSKGPKGMAGVFVRNSGTENKISVNLRGGTAHRKALQTIGDRVCKALLEEMKDLNNPYFKIEWKLLTQLAKKGILPEQAIQVEPSLKPRMLNEAMKQGLIQPADKGIRLAPLGKWYLGLHSTLSGSDE